MPFADSGVFDKISILVYHFEQYINLIMEEKEMDEMTIKILTDIIEAKGNDFDRHLLEARQRVLPVSEPIAIAAADPRFQLLTTFEVVVPTDYQHATRLDTFRRKHGKEFYYYNGNITDRNFSRATTQLAPGQQLKVKVFQITKKVTSNDCLVFLKNQNAVFTGAQGATLTYEQAKDQLPKGRWYVSFDERDTLPFVDGYHRVPYVNAFSDGDFEFGLGRFEDVWCVGRCLLCFCD